MFDQARKSKTNILGNFIEKTHTIYIPLNQFCTVLIIYYSISLFLICIFVDCCLMWQIYPKPEKKLYLATTDFCLNNHAH